MVFSSFPVYLDHPNLLQLQQPELHQPNPGVLDINPHQLPTPPPPGQAGSGLGSIRPGSMVDRARLAKIPLPEAGLKCPRCDSSNTKFCYFNNYNLSQPRHFCKTCRRYWTRGGALRSVPVGGGCRRNKKSKNSNNNNSRSKSAERSQMGGTTSTTTTPTSTTSPSSCSTDMNIIGHHSFTHSSPSLMAAFQNLNYYGGFQPPHHQLGVSHDQMGFQIRSNNSTNDHLQENQWKLPSFEQQPTNLYQSFQSDQGSVDHQAISHGNISSTPLEKIVENNNDSTKQFLGSLENNQYCGGNNTWTGFAGLNSSSSTGHFL